MSAIRGMPIDFLISERADAASASGTATRTISHPASSSRFIWETVASTSRVSVLVIDWTMTGAPPPIKTLPTFICLVFLRLIMSLSEHSQNIIIRHNNYQHYQQRKPHCLCNLHGLSVYRTPFDFFYDKK